MTFEEFLYGYFFVGLCMAAGIAGVWLFVWTVRIAWATAVVVTALFINAVREITG